MPLPQPWKIRPPGDRCQLTGEFFSKGQLFYSCLTEPPGADHLQREDYCEAAWEEVRKRKQPFSFWRSIYEPKPEPSPGTQAPLQPGNAESLLQQMMDQGDPGTETTRYILALQLEREKTLRQVGRERRNQRWVLVYEHRFTGEILLVADPELSLSHVAAVEHEVRQSLGPAGAPGSTSTAKPGFPFGREPA